jgi:hypothetical protein
MDLIGWATLYEANGVRISRHVMDGFTTVEELGETKIEGYRCLVVDEILRLAARVKELEEKLADTQSELFEAMNNPNCGLARLREAEELIDLLSQGFERDRPDCSCPDCRAHRFLNPGHGPK